MPSFCFHRQIIVEVTDLLKKPHNNKPQFSCLLESEQLLFCIHLMIGSSFQRYVQIILKIFYPVFNTFECQLFYFKSALKLELHVLEQQILYMNSMQGICL